MIKFNTPSNLTILDFFQKDRETGERKGILLLE